MMRFYAEVVYVPGKNLVVADTLSRSPVENADGTLCCVVGDHVVSVVDAWPVSDAMIQRIKDETRQD
jgi:hypothetical protein